MALGLFMFFSVHHDFLFSFYFKFFFERLVIYLLAFRQEAITWLTSILWVSTELTWILPLLLNCS